MNPNEKGFETRWRGYPPDARPWFDFGPIAGRSLRSISIPKNRDDRKFIFLPDYIREMKRTPHNWLPNPAFKAKVFDIVRENIF